MSRTRQILPVKAIAEFSDKGRRSVQEDCNLAIKDKGVFVLADGFGGPAGGVEAARAACESVQKFLIREAGDEEATLPFVLRSYLSLAGNVLFNALIYANIRVLKGNEGKTVHEKGGASVLAGYLDGDLLALANAGACTAWLCRGGRATELVVPRTYSRLTDPFAAVPDPTFQVPLTALGMSEDLEPEIFEYRLQPGDWLFLQTDGLHTGAAAKIAKLQLRSLETAVAGDEVLGTLAGATDEDNATGMVVFF